MNAVSRPFDKYERFGAYHWRELQSSPTRHNAVLAARYRRLLDAIDPTARRVLDIGCGDGALTFELARRKFQVCGLDTTLLPLRLARLEFNRRRRVRAPALLSGDARRLPFPDESFDCVVLADVIEHIDAPEAVLDEARRVLRPGGQVVLTTPRRQSTGSLHQHHCTEYVGPELAALVGRSFRDVEVRAFRPAVLARFYERKILGRKLFRIAINGCSILGWNPLAISAPVDAEDRHTDLCASGRKDRDRVAGRP